MNFKSLEKQKKHHKSVKNYQKDDIDQINNPFCVSAYSNGKLKFDQENDLSNKIVPQYFEGKEGEIDIRVSSEQKNKIYNRRKLLSNNEEIKIELMTCICCLHELFTYAYYECSHFVCLNCSTKMRILCKKLDCPICRCISTNVYCSKKEIDLKNFDLNTLIDQEFILDQESGIFFDQKNNLIKYEFDEILCNRCDICTKTLRPFQSFKELNIHMKKVHRRFYCELCLENLQLFPFERKHYTREELAVHKRSGDRDDFSFKGHPLCENCDVRFFDKDELYRHFRKDHYFCHFCDSDGIEEYYKDYNQLRQHFLNKHFLCELENCSANASQTHEYVVFRTELDLQAHKKQKHAKTKLEQKNLGKLNIEFNLTNSARDKYKRFVNQRSNYSEGSELKYKEKNNYDLDEKKIEESTEKKNQECSINKLESSLVDCSDSLETFENSFASTKNWNNVIKTKYIPKISQESEFPSLIPKENNKGFVHLRTFVQDSIWIESNANHLNKKTSVLNFQDDIQCNKEEKLENNKKDNLIDANLESCHENGSIEKKNIFNQPDNYILRNKEIDSKLLSLFKNFGNDVFEKFKKYSNDFRNGLINANDYLLITQNLLELPTSFNAYKNNKNLEKKKIHLEFLDLIQEVLILLPDVEKQNELFNSLEPLLDSFIKNDSKNSKKNFYHSKNNQPKFSKKLLKCLFCNQFLCDKEINLHQKKFHNDQDSSSLNQKEEGSKFGKFFEIEALKNENFKKKTLTSIIDENDFPSLNNNILKAKNPIWTIKETDRNHQDSEEKSKKKIDFNADFPPLESDFENNFENRISSLPTPTIFQNPSSHLSILNKKKHRLKK